MVGRLLLSRLLLLHLRASLLHSLVLFVHLFAVLVLLIAIEDTHELLAQCTARVAIDRATFRVRLRVLIDQRLHVLLLVAGEVEVTEALHPAMLEFAFTGGAGLVAVGLRRRGRALLGVNAERHGERQREHARGQVVHFHCHSILAALPEPRLNAGLGPGKRPYHDRVDRVHHVHFEAFEVIEEELRKLASLLVVGGFVGPGVARVEDLARHAGYVLGDHQTKETLGLVVVGVGPRSPR